MAFAGLKDTEMQENIDVQSSGNFLLFQTKFKMIHFLKDCSKNKKKSNCLAI